MNFPNSPALNDTYTLGSKTWKWNGVAWDLQSTALASSHVVAALGYTPLNKAGDTITGSLNFSGSNLRITGDFTSSSRLLVQTTSANSNTVFGLIPSGTAVNSQFHVWGAEDITNAPLGAFTINSAQVQIQSTAAGTGTVLPFRLLVGSTEVFRATTASNFLIGSSTDNGTDKLQVTGSMSLSSALRVGATPSAGTSGQVLTSGGSGAAPTWTTLGGGGFSNMAVFTSSTTWTIPAGVTKCLVYCTGGGGAGDMSSGGSAQGLSGGGAGGTAIKTYTLSGSTASITIGAAGTSASSGGGGGRGGDSTFTYGATTITGYGGYGCSFAQRAGGGGGYAANGDLNLNGGSGDSSGNASNAAQTVVGGASFWGGGAQYGSGPYGAGGSGVQYTSSAGIQGVVVIFY